MAFSLRLMCLVSSRDDLALLPALVRAGVDAFQVRDKELDGGALVDLTRAVLESSATVIVNDRLDVALVAGAHGVHLGAGDLRVADARRLAPGLVIGATCRSRADVEEAARDGADYAGFGPVFATSSKDGLPDPLGPAAVADALGVLPTLAIGGITPANATELPPGAGVAVIGGIWSQPDPVVAAARLAEAVAR